MTDKCARCSGDMPGIKISSSDGWICERCWYITNPFEECATFRDVLHNGDDQVLMRELVDSLVPSDMRCSDLGITAEVRKEQA